MPRTKVMRKITRNRLAVIREEKIREYDSKLEQFINAFDWKIKQSVQEIEIEIELLKSRIPQKMRVMKLGDLMNLRVRTFSDIEPTVARIEQLKSRARLVQPQKRSKDDEGYLTEDSRGSTRKATIMSVSHSRLFANTQRHPGPLGSAKVIRRRRSRSACGKITQPICEDGHVSRQLTRTPMLTRQKAFSADRSANKPKHVPNSPTLLRWPKPGELVVSVTGSPVVAQIMPESFANVNIPVRDGVISLRPKKLQNVDPELVHRIDRETLSQIKLLQSNLEMIMRFAHKK